MEKAWDVGMVFGRLVSKPAKASVASTIPRSATGIGTIVGLADKCLDIANAQSDDGTVVQLTTCHQMKAKIWNLLKDKMIQALGECLTRVTRIVEIDACDGGDGQAWRIASGVVVNTGSGDCLGCWAGIRGIARLLWSTPALLRRVRRGSCSCNQLLAEFLVVEAVLLGIRKPWSGGR